MMQCLLSLAASPSPSGAEESTVLTLHGFLHNSFFFLFLCLFFIQTTFFFFYFLFYSILSYSLRGVSSFIALSLLARFQFLLPRFFPLPSFFYPAFYCHFYALASYSPSLRRQGSIVFVSCLASRPFGDPLGGHETLYLFDVSLKVRRGLKVTSSGHLSLGYSSCLPLYPSQSDLLREHAHWLVRSTFTKVGRSFPTNVISSGFLALR